MGGEWKRLLGRSALYILLVLAFPVLLVTALLIKGKGPADGLWELSMYLFTQGWGMVGILLAIQLGSKMWQEEHRGAWEYRASLPHGGLWLLWHKLMPRLIILLAWCAVFLVLRLPASTRSLLVDHSGVPDLFVHPLQVLVLSLVWFFYSGFLSVMRETDNVRRQFFGWFGLGALLITVWALGTGVQNGYLKPFRMDGKALGALLGPEGILLFGLLALIGLLPLVWIHLKAVGSLTGNSPERFASLFLRVGLPVYALPWVWFIGAIVTGGFR